ncbi:MAG: N-acetyltransferase [Clostridia bacterium]
MKKEKESDDMTYQLTEVRTNRQLRAFIRFPFQIYRKDDNWVAPLNLLIKRTLRGKDNPLFSNGPHITFLLHKDGKPVARLVAGIDEKVNREKGLRRGYIALFECVNDKESAFYILDQARNWLKDKGMQFMEGPVSPTNGDDYRGLLVKGFETSPTLFNSYNPPYYNVFFEAYGFHKFKDLVAFDFSVERYPLERFEKTVAYSLKKYDFRVDPVDVKQIDREIRDIREILEQAVPEEWENFVVPSLEDIRKEARFLIPFIDPDFVCIARRNADDRPLGFVVGALDYNQVFKKLKGSLFPFGIFKFLYHRKRITGLRLFIQFVVPDYQGRAINTAIFHHFFKNALKRKLEYAEGGTVGEDNVQSNKILMVSGGLVSKIYRIYRKDI